MSDPSIVVITGITSYLGAALGVYHLRRGEQVVALYHGPSKDVHYALNLIDPGKHWHRGKLDIVATDLSKPDLGMDAEQKQQILSAVKTFYHCACYLSSQAKQAGDINENLRILERMTRLFRELRARSFVYISSFGVAGNDTGVIEESVAPDSRSFHNIYEKAMAANERFLLKALPNHSIIFRPSAVVEAISDEWKAGIPVSWTAVYNLVKCLMSLKTMLGIENFAPLNLEGRELFISGRKLNMIPVDQAVDVIVSASQKPTALGRIINLLNPHDIDYFAFLRELFDYFQVKNIHIRLGPGPAKLPKRDDDQILFYLSRIIKVLNPYVRDDRVFQLDNLNVLYPIERLHRFQKSDIKAMIDRSLALDFGESIPASIKELRRYARYSTSIMIGIKKENADDYEVGTGCDVSLSGLRLRTTEHFLLDEELQISFDPDPAIGDIKAKAKVVWKKDQSEGMHLLGLEFSFLEAAMRQRLQLYIDALNRQSEAS